MTTSIAALCTSTASEAIQSELSCGPGVGVVAGFLERHQHRHEHHPRSVRGGHEEGPEREAKQSGLQADADAVAVAIGEIVDAPSDEQTSREDAEHSRRQRLAERHHGIDDDGDRRRVAQADRQQRKEHDRAALPVQPSATANSQPMAGLRPWKAPSPIRAIHGQSSAIVAVLAAVEYVTAA